MVLTTMNIDAVTPRGGPSGTPITVTGSGFGVSAGTLVFDPQGSNVSATPLTWDDDTITFNVPVGIPFAHTATLVIEKLGGTDSAVTPFWSPAATPSADGLDYGYPADEAGPNQDVDDPRKFTARDFNRVVDRVKNVPTPAGLIHADGSVPFVADQSMGGHSLTNLVDPAVPQAAATKNYVDTQRTTVVPRTVDAALTVADENKLQTNTGASADLALTLPLLGVGARHHLAVTVGHYIRLNNFDNTTTITIGVVGGVQKVTVAGGFVRSTAVGSRLDIERVSPTQWFAKVTGDWTIDS